MQSEIPPLGTKEYLVALRDTCNSIIRALNSERANKPWPINWADLSCIATYWTRDHEGAEFPSLIISEASPDAGDFRAAIYEALSDLGFKDVEVRTEW